MKKIKWNATTTWLLPMLGVPLKEWERAQYINAYLEDKMSEKSYKGLTIRLLFKPTEQGAELIEDIIQSMPEMIDMYGHNKEYVVVVMQIDDRWQEDYNKIMKGEYSKLSNDYKDLVSDKVYTMDRGYQKRAQTLIMERHSSIKKIAASVIKDMSNVTEGEVWSKPLIDEEETLSLELLNSLV